MKKMSLLVLVTGITLGAIAQQEQFSNTDKAFEIPAGAVKRSFIVDLGKGNTMQLELGDIADLARFKNIDSLLRVFLQDIIPLKDSLADELASKRIDHVTDELGRKKIRIQLTKPQGNSFVLQTGELAALKLEQDTVNFIGSKPYTEGSTLLKPYTEIRYYRLSFFVNQLADLEQYLDGSLNVKISEIQKNEKARWIKGKDDRWYIKNGDQSIYSNHQPAGYVGASGDYLTSRWGVSIQNYKNYFVPSLSLGAAVVFNNGRIKREIGLHWEPNFFFAKNAEGNLKTYRNDFVTISYGQKKIRKPGEGRETEFLNMFSLSYLVNRNGNYFEKNSFRVGAGQVSLFGGKVKLEPLFYFNDLFKGVTPGIRLSLGF